MCISIGHLSALCQEIVSPLSNWESDTLGNTQIRRPLWERTAFSRTNCPYPSDIPANGSANGSSPREKFLGTSENTRMETQMGWGSWTSAREQSDSECEMAEGQLLSFIIGFITINGWREKCSVDVAAFVENRRGLLQQDRSNLRRKNI